LFEALGSSETPEFLSLSLSLFLSLSLQLKK